MHSLSPVRFLCCKPPQSFSPPKVLLSFTNPQSLPLIKLLISEAPKHPPQCFSQLPSLLLFHNSLSKTLLCPASNSVIVLLYILGVIWRFLSKLLKLKEEPISRKGRDQTNKSAHVKVVDLKRYPVRPRRNRCMKKPMTARFRGPEASDVSV